MKRIVAILIVLSMAVGLASTASAITPQIVKNADPQQFDMDTYYDNLWNVYQELFEKDMIPYLENEQLQHYIYVAKESEKDWLYNFTVFLTGTELDYETCIEILCNMLVALRMDTIEMMANQKDTNKNAFDYVMDIIGITAGTIGAESYFGGNFTEAMKTVADVIDLTADNIDMLLEVRENAQCMYDTIQCYDIYSEFLSAIATGCHHKEMREAASVLLSGVQKLFAAKTNFLSEYVEDYGKYAVEVFGGDLLFGQIMPLLTEGEVAEMWDEGELTALKVLDNTVLFVDNAVSAVTLGKDLGVFACDMLFGATNVRTHVQEALAMTYIREALLKELEACRKTIKSGKDYGKIYNLSRLATGILYVNYRGNYCITEALTQDAQLHSVIMQGSGEAERYLKLLQDYHTETVSYGKIAGSMLLPLDDVRIDDVVTDAYYKECYGEYVVYSPMRDDYEWYEWSDDDYQWSEGIITFRIPEININSEAARKINAEIYESSIGDIEIELKAIEENGKARFGVPNVWNYKWYINSDILTIFGSQDKTFIPEMGSRFYYKVYNFSMAEEELLQNNGIIARTNNTQENFYEQVKDILGKEYWKYINSFQGFWSEDMVELGYEKTISQDNIENAQAYINENGDLSFVASIIAPNDINELMDRFITIDMVNYVNN